MLTDDEFNEKVNDLSRQYLLEHSSTVLVNVHSEKDCEPPCCIHSKTDHTMRSFPQYWRSDRWIMERTCPHGIGHPDPDQRFPEGSGEWVHACDGCCTASISAVEPQDD